MKKHANFKSSTRKWRTWIISGAIMLVGCSRTPSTRGNVVGPNANPVADAFVIYGFKGQSVQGFWGSPFAAGIIRTNASGEFHIPAKIHIFPMFSDPPFDHYVYAIYSPKLHSVSDAQFADHRPTIRLENNANNLISRWKSIDRLGNAIKRFYVPGPHEIMSSNNWRECVDSFKNEIKEYRDLDKLPPTRILEYAKLADEISERWSR